MGGLQYEVHRMPPGMRDKVVSQVLAKISASSTDPDPCGCDDEKEKPCMSCLRWEECMGVAMGRECPF